MNTKVPKPVKQVVPDLPRKSRGLKSWWLIGGILGAIATALLIVVVATKFNTLPNGPAHRPDTSQTTPSPHPPPPRADRPLEPPDSVIDDDGTTFWVSPTSGRPLDLSYLAPGAQVIVAIRPADIGRHMEGKKLLQALGPIGQQIVTSVERSIPLALDVVDELIVGCRPTSDGRWLKTFVAHSNQPIIDGQIIAKLPNATKKTRNASTYYVADGIAYFVPAGSKNILVATPEESIGDVMDLAGQPPALRRDIERLLTSTNSNRHFTIVLAPNALFAEGQDVLSGELAPLRNALFWFLGDEFSCVALSLHWDTNFFAEVSATPTLETSAEKATQILEQRVQQIPDKVESFVSKLKPQPYGRLLVERLPAMTRNLAAFSRGGFDKDHAVLRCYLPPAAGHNLLLAGELMLAESTNEVSATADAARATANQAVVLDAGKSALNKVTSLKFARDTLESALEQLSQDIGVPIVIRGADLQADGITKNQSFGIDLSNKPAAEILVEILRLANPDKAATGPRDPRQKLVYVMGQAPDKTLQIVVTTRARAAERRDELPAVFQTEKQ